MEGFGLIGVVIVLGLLALVGLALVRGSRATRRVAQSNVAQARAEVQHQVDALAERILSFADGVLLGPPDAQHAYAQATAEFKVASEGLEQARTRADLAELNDELDRARWQLEVATALTEGREPPPTPAGERPACFFDPDHGAGVKEAMLQTPAGARAIGVCDYCAMKLERGEAPRARQLKVGRRSVPAPKAPREYGGRAQTNLDTFSVSIGDRAPVSYRWR